MRVVAIIPARAGSRGIPNKNIRLVGDHPLCWYAIKNALSSKVITDVVVTTDSTQVGIIAKQMGAKVHWRDETLCGDDVTLDAVIYDAVPKDIEWDYIVTMQPTSPTLTVDTLDKAVRKAVDKGLDTLISVTNDPKLSWSEGPDGSPCPNYKERLNRQWLPPEWVETGAFVVSRASVVTPETRIGEKVGVFEVPDEEGVDVDTFADLRTVAAYLEHEHVGIYVNGNNTRGVGHIYRALELADEFYSKPDIFYDINQTDPKVFGRTTHTLIGVNGIADLFGRLQNVKYTLFINDILTTSIDYMIGLRSVLPADCHIVNFEDDGEGATKADIVFNALYAEEAMPNIKAGEKYYISPKPFLFYNPINIREKVKQVFICFGGADPQNYSDRLLNIIASNQEKYAKYQFVVVLGRAKSNVKELMRYNNKPNIKILYDVSNMPELMSQCDIAITSRGRTGYELAMLGIPSIAMAQNKREEKHGFISNENGFDYIGLNPPDEIIKSNLDMFLELSKNARRRFQDMLLSHDLRNGRRRIMALIDSL
jgi:CMP-N-acetylneuraminic acid synthetase/spore coat polysaccharide biosynthesis predicted glycosyltransferase SpsG